MSLQGISKQVPWISNFSTITEPFLCLLKLSKLYQILIYSMILMIRSDFIYLLGMLAQKQHLHYNNRYSLNNLILNDLFYNIFDPTKQESVWSSHAFQDIFLPQAKQVNLSLFPGNIRIESVQNSSQRFQGMMTSIALVVLCLIFLVSTMLCQQSFKFTSC